MDYLYDVFISYPSMLNMAPYPDWVSKFVERLSQQAAPPARTATSHIGMGGKQWVEDLIAPLNTGLVTNQMCIEAGDPIGLHHLQVRAGGKVIYSVDFEVAPDDGFYEWKPEATAPAQTGAAKVEKFSDTAPRRKAEDRQATKAATPPAATAK